MANPIDENKRREFRKFLGEVVRDDSGSLTAFSKKCHLSVSHLSQQVNEENPRSISYETVEDICRSLKSREIAKELYRRYVSVFGDDPNKVRIDSFDHDAVNQFLSSARGLVGIGYQRYVQSTAQSLFQNLRNVPGRDEQAIRAAMFVADGYFLRGLQPRGLEMLKLVEPRVLAGAGGRLAHEFYRLRAIGYQPLGPRFLVHAKAALTNAETALASATGDVKRTGATQIRDAAQLAWHEFQWGSGNEKLRRSLEELDSTLPDWGSVDRLQTLETLSRGWVALGEYDLAQRHLADLAASQQTPLLKVKRTLTEIRLHLATGNIPDAHEQIVSIVELCEDGLFGNYQRVAFRLQDQMVSGENEF